MITEYQALSDCQRDIGTKHFPESKNFPESKTLSRIQNTSQNPKHFPESRNTSQNPKTLSRIQKHFPECKTLVYIENCMGKSPIVKKNV